MENKLIFDLEQQLNNIDIDNIKLDAIIQLKFWQKKMFSLVEKTYLKRLNEIDEIALNINNEVKEKQTQLEQQIKINNNNNNKTTLLKLQHDIDQLKSDIIINQKIPENFHHLIQRTIHVNREDENQDDDDDFVIVNIDKQEEKIETNSESRITKILNSQPVQQALTVTLAQTLTQVGAIAITNPTTIAATTIAKAALVTTAYGLGRIAIGTTKKVCSFM